MSRMESEVEDAGGASKIRLALLALAAGALVLFIFQNTDDAQVDFLWMNGSIPLFLLLLITVALTLIVAMMVTWFLRRRD